MGRAIDGGLRGPTEVGDVILTTTPSVEGYDVQAYLGIVAAEAIMGANIFRDLVAGITDVLGGRAGEYEEKLAEAREIVLGEPAARARERGADAVIGIDIDYETVRDGTLMVTAAGTAVRLAPRAGG